jgi:hypothetical protein
VCSFPIGLRTQCRTLARPTRIACGYARLV